MSNFVPEKTALGIEFGSTRIKAVLIGPEHTPLAQGDYTWENQLHNGIWTYPLEQVWQGLQSAYAALAADVQQKYGCTLTKVGCIGISAMMHGYLAFDANGELLVPFRTWRNTITGEASAKLSELFGFNIPQRWSVAHLYQAILNGEEHTSRIDYLTTLAGYIHWKLTGRKVMGVGEASGMFPIDPATHDYDRDMLAKFADLIAPKGFGWKIDNILPTVLCAGDDAGALTAEGARLLDADGHSALPARGRRRNRHDRHQFGAPAHRQYLRRHVHFLHDGTGKAAAECEHRHRPGDHALRLAGRHGALQQLHLRSERLGGGI